MHRKHYYYPKKLLLIYYYKKLSYEQKKKLFLINYYKKDSHYLKKPLNNEQFSRFQLYYEVLIWYDIATTVVYYIITLKYNLLFCMSKCSFILANLEVFLVLWYNNMINWFTNEFTVYILYIKHKSFIVQ